MSFVQWIKRLQVKHGFLEHNKFILIMVVKSLQHHILVKSLNFFFHFERSFGYASEHENMLDIVITLYLT